MVVQRSAQRFVINRSYSTSASTATQGSSSGSFVAQPTFHLSSFGAGGVPGLEESGSSIANAGGGQYRHTASAFVSVTSNSAVPSLGDYASTNTAVTQAGVFPSQEIRSILYKDVSEALGQLHGVADDSWRIDTGVYAASMQVATALMANNIPQPGVFTHGPRSVVFNWTRGDTNLYLTVSRSRLSVLVSSADGIELRAKWTDSNQSDANRFFSAVGFAGFISPPESPAEVAVVESK